MAIKQITDAEVEIIGRPIVFGECCVCGIPVAMTPTQRRIYNEQGTTMHCVLGHQTVRIKTDNQQLREQLAAAQAKVTQAETAFHNTDQMLEVKIKENKRLKKQAAKGQCAHCEEYFSDLHRHVKRMHRDKL